MAELWTDLIEPAELTGYAREAAEDYEARQGSLAAWLPNREIADITARFVVGSTGLLPEANFRAYDAPPELGKQRPGRRVAIDLPALGQSGVVSEYFQLRSRNASEPEIRNAILDYTRTVVRSIADRMERQRGIALVTGKSTIDQPNFYSEDDFGRDARLTTTASTLWTASTDGRLEYLEGLADLYEELNGERPGTMLMSRKAARLLKAGADFRVNTIGSTGAPSTATMNGILDDHDLPSATVFERKTFGGRVIPENVLLMLPGAVDRNAWQSTQLGATFWGRTLTSQDPAYGLADTDMPGVVVGAYRQPTPPQIAEVHSDAIGLPVLANANLSLAATIF